MARRSTRLSSRTSATPQPLKRVSLSHDATGRTPKTAPHKLSSLAESDEMPGSFPESPVETTPTQPAKRSKKVALNDVTELEPVATPKNTTPIRPSTAEMHPQANHQTTAKPLEEARWLGFSNMQPQTEPPKQRSNIAELQVTPSKSAKSGNAFQSPDFQFTFQREQSLELSPEAKRLMQEKRAEAARIKEQMRAQSVQEEDESAVHGRKMATPKSKGNKGRFSDLHKQQFQKMDSIAGHASAFRSLKRSPSKADLDDKEDSSLAKGAASHLPRSTSTKSLRPDPTDEPGSPAKRMKRANDTLPTRPTSSGSNNSKPSTPVRTNVSSIATPTQASLARQTSTKTTNVTKIPAPHLSRSPSKPSLFEAAKEIAKTSAPLLHRSPLKMSVAGTTREAQPESSESQEPLLARSPLKMSTSGVAKAAESATGAESSASAKLEPLLARSPLKSSVARSAEPEQPKEKQPALLARSPSKASHNPFVTEPSATPSKPSNLMSRFGFLRSSPMKSILRSPQRLYSDDPAKVAAGTHLATPPGKKATQLNKALPKVPATAPVQKRVDFSNSTKQREEVREASSTPSKGPTPPPKDTIDDEMTQNTSIGYPNLPPRSPIVMPTPQNRRQTIAPGDFTFRAGNGILFSTSPNAPATAPSKRPSIRHVSAEPDLPPAPATVGSKKRKFSFENNKASAEAEKAFSPTKEAGSKKRKLSFEDAKATAEAATAGHTSDKENAEEVDEGEMRAKKRTKANPLPATTASTGSVGRLGGLGAKRVPTLGVKPKGTKTAVSPEKDKKKRASTISQARLAALAMPKKRA